MCIRDSPCTIPRAFPRVPATDATRNRTPELFPSRARARACATIPLPVDRRRAIRVPNSTDHDSYPRVTTDRFQGLASRARSVPSCAYIPSPHSDNVFIVHTQEPLSNTKTRQSKRKALVARDDADAVTLARAMRMDDRRRRRKTTDDRRPMATTMRGACDGGRAWETVGREARETSSRGARMRARAMRACTRMNECAIETRRRRPRGRGWARSMRGQRAREVSIV